MILWVCSSKTREFIIKIQKMPYTTLHSCIFHFTLLHSTHSLKLLYSPIETMLHHITQIEITLSNLVIWHLQYGFTILQCEAITLDTFECLCTSDECFDVFWFDFKNCCAVCVDVNSGREKKGCHVV